MPTSPTFGLQLTLMEFEFLEMTPMMFRQKERALFSP